MTLLALLMAVAFYSAVVALVCACVVCVVNNRRGRP